MSKLDFTGYLQKAQKAGDAFTNPAKESLNISGTLASEAGRIKGLQEELADRFRQKLSDFKETLSKALMSAAQKSQLKNSASLDFSPLYFSRGRGRESLAGLGDGENVFEVSLGNQTGIYSITGYSGARWGEALDMTAKILNSGAISLRAEVISQTKSFEKLSGLASIGESLVIGLSKSNSNQSLYLKDLRGHFMERMGIISAITSLTGLVDTPKSEFSTVSYISRTLSTEEYPKLSPGIKSFTVLLGDMIRSVYVSISKGDTWSSVASRIINAVQTKVFPNILFCVSPIIPVSSLSSGVISLGMVIKFSSQDENFVMEDQEGDLLKNLGLNRVSNSSVPGFSISEAASDLETYGASSEANIYRNNLQAVLEEIAAAYNDTRSFVLANAEDFNPELPGALRQPTLNLAKEMTSLGLIETEPDKKLFVRPAFSNEALADFDNSSGEEEQALNKLTSAWIAEIEALLDKNPQFMLGRDVAKQSPLSDELPFLSSGSGLINETG